MERLTGTGRNLPLRGDPRRPHARGDDRHLRRVDDARRLPLRRDQGAHPLAGCTSSRRSAAGWCRCRSSSTIRCGSRTPTSTSTTTCAASAVPLPGGRRELAEVAAQIASIPLDRTRPLWEAWVIEGLKHDRVGFVVKVHHSAIDGASGAEIMTELYDLTPEGRDLEPVEPEPERIPTDQELLTYAAAVEAAPGTGRPSASSDAPSAAIVEPGRSDPRPRLDPRRRPAHRAPHTLEPHRSARTARCRSPASPSTRPRRSRTPSG